MTERKTVTIAEITVLVSDGSTLNLANRSLTELPGINLEYAYKYDVNLLQN